MIDISPFTEEQWWQLCSCNCDLPISLNKADFNKPFVYDRKYGVFYTPAGYHNITMATLLAFSYRLIKPTDVCSLLNIKNDPFIASDYWIENTPGVAFKSSVSDKVHAGKAKYLNQNEKDYFGKITYIFS